MLPGLDARGWQQLATRSINDAGDITPDMFRPMFERIFANLVADAPMPFGFDGHGRCTVCFSPVTIPPAAAGSSPRTLPAGNWRRRHRQSGRGAMNISDTGRQRAATHRALQPLRSCSRTVESNLPTYRKRPRPDRNTSRPSIRSPLRVARPVSSPSRRLRFGMRLRPTVGDPQVHHLYAFVCKRWAIEPELFRLNSLQKMPD